MKLRHLVYAVAACLIVSLGAVLLYHNLNLGSYASNGPRADSDRAPKKSPYPLDDRIVSADNGFGFRLFAEVRKQDSGKNVFISPLSIATALSMAYNGAAGGTKDAMAKTMQVEGLSLDEVNKANSALIASLENHPPESWLEMTIADSLWIDDGMRLKADFIKRTSEFYWAEARNLDLQDPKAPSVINSWVEKETRGKIRKIVDDTSGMVAYLINATYFKGRWFHTFDKSKTREREFTLPSGKQKMHPLMHQSGDYAYYKGDGFQAVCLPYGQGSVGMYIFLPDKTSSLTKLCSTLTHENWRKWMTSFRETPGEIAVPRFKFEYGLDLVEPLKQLGMGVAFDSAQADFSAMTSAQVWIGEAKHKTFVDVNEEGTEAAAVTAIGFAGTALNPEPPPPFKMIVDRPFFFAIVDGETDAVLFMGSVVDPQ